MSTDKNYDDTYDPIPETLLEAFLKTKPHSGIFHRVLSKYTIKSIKLEPKEKISYKFDVELVDKKGNVIYTGVLNATNERFFFEEKETNKPIIVELPFDEITKVSKHTFKRKIYNIKINEDTFMFRFLHDKDLKKFGKMVDVWLSPILNN